MAALGVATLSLFPGVDANVVMGAFAGSLLFVMTSADPSIPKRVAFFVISFVAGCLTAELFAAGLDAVLPARIDVHAGIGALIASALVVKLLLWLIAQADAPDRLLNVFKGREK
ncbi:LysA [Burkholderia phage Carl1]|uniref:LysA n=1 Tax=Burkholderia phage Carl1 TaxID=2951185 RepID=A0A9E7SJ31_9CAUD|nr:LysA [Burkholderia phage Carl1]